MKPKNLIGLFAVIAVMSLYAVKCEAKAKSHGIIKSFFSDNVCQELEIQIFPEDYKFIFTPEESVIQFSYNDKEKIDDTTAAEILKLVDSLKIQYSPKGKRFFKKDYSERELPKDNFTTIFFTFSTKVNSFEVQLGMPISNGHDFYRYDPLFVELIEKLALARKQVRERLPMERSYDGILPKWTKTDSISHDNRILSCVNENEHPEIIDYANLKEYFAQTGIRKIRIERTANEVECKMGITSDGGWIIFSTPDGDERRLALTSDVMNHIVTLISRFNLRDSTLLDCVVQSNKEITHVGNLRRNNGWIRITIDKNRANSTMRASLLPIVDNHYIYSYWPAFNELLETIDNLVKE